MLDTMASFNLLNSFPFSPLRALNNFNVFTPNHPPNNVKKKLPSLPKVICALLDNFCAGSIVLFSIFLSIADSLPSLSCCSANLLSSNKSCCSFLLSNA